MSTSLGTFSVTLGTGPARADGAARRRLTLASSATKPNRRPPSLRWPGSRSLLAEGKRFRVDGGSVVPRVEVRRTTGCTSGDNGFMRGVNGWEVMVLANELLGELLAFFCIEA